MIRRILAAGIAAAAITAVAVVSPATPSGATVDFEDLAGNFAGDEREEIFVYGVGTNEDALVTFDNGGVSGGPLTTEAFPFTVNGVYDPVVGNFDGDAYDEIIWYRAGTGADNLWNFTSLTTVESTPLTISGTYQPVAGDFTGDGVDDVLWYAPGSAADNLWDFNADGGHVSIPFTINGRYTPIAASIGADATDDVFWYAPGTATDYLWDFVAGTTSYASSHPYAVNGTYQPFVFDPWNDGPQGDDIFWYAPGTAPDYVWDFITGRRVFVLNETVNGRYDSTAAGDFFADGFDDVLWAGQTTAYLWDHIVIPDEGFHLTRWNYDLTAGQPITPSGPAASAAEADATVPATPGGTVATRD